MRIQREREAAEMRAREHEDRRRATEIQKAAEAKLRQQRRRLQLERRKASAQAWLRELADAYRKRINIMLSGTLGCVRARVRVRQRVRGVRERQARIQSAKEMSTLKSKLSTAVSWARKQLSPGPNAAGHFSEQAHHQPPKSIEEGAEWFPEDFEEDLGNDDPSCLMTSNPME